MRDNRIFSLLLATTMVVSAGFVEMPAVAAALPGFSNSFHPNLVADVAENVAPSVVNIDVEQTTQPQEVPGFFFNDEILRRFFGHELQGQFTPFQQRMLPPQTVNGNGSGMILDRAGHILTNNHVVAGADKITVTLNDGRKFPATILGRDAQTDVAVLKINAPNLTPVRVGDSTKLRPGEWVLAIGSPMGFDHSVTFGIVSALSRRIPADAAINPNLEFIQTDAAINPGNSGGPLVNLSGEVVGINTAILRKGQNIGFAIPINTVSDIANKLIAGEPILRPWIGISMATLNPELAKHIGLSPDTQGVVVAQVMEGSPAARAGFMQGDIIRRVNGKDVLKSETIQEMVRETPINSRLNMEIVRNGQPMQRQVAIEPMPEEPTQALAPQKPRVMPPQGGMMVIPRGF